MSRTQTIEEILSDLRSLKERGFENSYALEQNIGFFENIKKFSSYRRWLKTTAPHIDPDRLLELSDLPLSKWDRQLHLELSEASRKKFPGMVKPLEEEILSQIKNNGVRLIADLGCGGMEVVAQVIEQLKNSNERVVFFGIDQSPVVNEIIKMNLQRVSDLVDIVEMNQLDSNIVSDMVNSSAEKHRVVICKNNIFTLDQVFAPKQLDLVFHTRFKHHLDGKQKQLLDAVIQKISKNLVEFDEYKDMFLPLVQGIATWKTPVLMNGAVLSRIRETPKEEIIAQYQGDQLKFFKLLGAYIRVKKY